MNFLVIALISKKGTNVDPQTQELMKQKNLLMQQKGTLESSIQTIESNLQQSTETVQQLDSEITQIESDITEVEQNIAQLQQENVQLQTYVNNPQQLQDDIEVLQTDVDQLQNDIETIEIDLEDKQEEVYQQQVNNVLRPFYNIDDVEQIQNTPQPLKVSSIHYISEMLQFTVIDDIVLFVPMREYIMGKDNMSLKSVRHDLRDTVKHFYNLTFEGNSLKQLLDQTQSTLHASFYESGDTIQIHLHRSLKSYIRNETKDIQLFLTSFTDELIDQLYKKQQYNIDMGIQWYFTSVQGQTGKVSVPTQVSIEEIPEHIYQTVTGYEKLTGQFIEGPNGEVTHIQQGTDALLYIGQTQLSNNQGFMFFNLANDSTIGQISTTLDMQNLSSYDFNQLSDWEFFFKYQTDYIQKYNGLSTSSKAVSSNQYEDVTIQQTSDQAVFSQFELTSQNVDHIETDSQNFIDGKLYIFDTQIAQNLPIGKIRIYDSLSIEHMTREGPVFKSQLDIYNVHAWRFRYPKRHKISPIKVEIDHYNSTLWTINTVQNSDGGISMTSNLDVTNDFHESAYGTDDYMEVYYLFDQHSLTSLVMSFDGKDYKVESDQYNSHKTIYFNLIVQGIPYKQNMPLIERVYFREVSRRHVNQDLNRKIRGRSMITNHTLNAFQIVNEGPYSPFGLLPGGIFEFDVIHNASQDTIMNITPEALGEDIYMVEYFNQNGTIMLQQWYDNTKMVNHKNYQQIGHFPGQSYQRQFNIRLSTAGLIETQHRETHQRIAIDTGENFRVKIKMLGADVLHTFT